MPLAIETFSNAHGGNVFFKALCHPMAAEKGRALVGDLAAKRNVAIYDPYGQASAFNELFDLSNVPVAGYYVQNVEHRGRSLRGKAAQLITDIGHSKASALLITSFETERLVAHIRHLLPPGLEIFSLDALRLPQAMLTDARRYLSLVNFATNFVFFRDQGLHHTRLTTANYWSGYGAKAPVLWCRLYDNHGKVLAEWNEPIEAGQSVVVLDSHDIRRRFALPEFTGQLFVHVIGIAGHDVVKYALDTYGDADDILSCTHDSNSWPADFYAGLPAPDAGEDVVLWIQNSHPVPIPAGEIGLNVMGGRNLARLDHAIPPFATFRLGVSDLLPDARWPQQVEVVAGKYFTRPRYEVFTKEGRQRIAHVNVERTDLKPDAVLPTLGNVIGKGFILPAPVLPLDRYASMVLPTPMATTQSSLPLSALVYDSGGHLVCERRLGNLPRNHDVLLDVGRWLEDERKTLSGGYGHVEIVYDYSAGKEADGWLHGLFRYIDRQSGHAADSSFGAHMFNTVLTYRNEPQSYAGRAPGLSTRLFLRVGQKPYETFCHLIYPASLPWRERSDTSLILFDRRGKEIARETVSIPCSGSLLWRVSETFGAPRVEAAGENCYVMIQDSTCRLFGYHGLMGARAFSLDHMFGF